MLARIRNTASFIRSETTLEPEIGIILGTGLGGLADHIRNPQRIEYGEIPDFPVSTVEGHRGRLIFGELGGRRVVAMQGRFHFYEGYTPQQVVFPVRVMKLLGVRTLIVSNAAGGVNERFRTGDLMVITDHINLIPNPLIGPNIDELGPRFPDMSQAYDRAIIDRATAVAEREGIPLRYGCYVGNPGPTFETPREYAWFRTIGGDAVGMSTTPEVIAARHMGMAVFGLSAITNVGLAGEKSTHEEVQIEGAKASERMVRLVEGLLREL